MDDYDDYYIDDGDTKGLIEEYRYRKRSGFFRKYGGRWNSLRAIVVSLFK